MLINVNLLLHGVKVTNHLRFTAVFDFHGLVLMIVGVESCRNLQP